MKSMMLRGSQLIWLGCRWATDTAHTPFEDVLIYCLGVGAFLREAWCGVAE